MHITICRHLAAALVVVVGAPSAHAVILGSGSNANTTAASLQAAGGPATTDFGFNNVGKSPTGGASVTYLGNGWGITAGHNTMDATFNTVNFGGTSYTVDPSTITFLHNPNSSLADLKLFRLTTEPTLPEITPALLSGTAGSGVVVMVGNGRNTTSSQQFWSVDKSNPLNWVWTNTGSQPGTVTSDDYSGFSTGGSQTIRWGSNVVVANDLPVQTGTDGLGNLLYVNAFATRFDNAAYTGVAPLSDEAQATVGDSGGGVFRYDGSQWQLAGIMVAVSATRSQQPSNTALYGDFTLIADLSVYRDQILSIIVPEPASIVMAICGGAVVLAAGWRSRKRMPR